MNVYDLNPTPKELVSIGLQNFDQKKPKHTREELDTEDLTDDNLMYIWCLYDLRGNKEEADKWWKLLPDYMKWPYGWLGNQDIKAPRS